MSKIKAYDVRVQLTRGRITHRVAAVNAAEARGIAVRRYGGEVVACRRSDYAVGVSEQRERREYLASLAAR